MKNQLVVQLPLSESTDFDTLISIEDGLAELFKDNRQVVIDGHDIGQGRFNVFVHSDEPWPAVLGRIRAFLEFRGVLDGAVIATRPLDGEEYQVLWPSDHEHEFQL